MNKTWVLAVVLGGSEGQIRLRCFTTYGTLSFIFSNGRDGAEQVAGRQGSAGFVHLRRKPKRRVLRLTAFRALMFWLWSLDIRIGFFV
ncbi:hypothetical protein COP1_011556 [Malus domestica]